MTLINSTIPRAQLPALGSIVDGDIYRGVTYAEDGVAEIAVFEHAEITDDGMPWKAAIEHVAALATDTHPAGSYSLATRREGRLLAANSPPGEGVFWLSEQYSASYAWYQYFSVGSQGIDYKFSKLRARAVRRLVIQ